MFDLTFEYGVRLDLERRMNDVAFDVGTGFEFNLTRSDGAFDAAFDAYNFGFHFAGYVATGTNRNVCRGDITIDSAVDLEGAFRRDRAIDLHVGADDGSCTGGRLGRRAADRILRGRRLHGFWWGRGVIGFAILREHDGLLSKTLLDHMLYR